MGCDWVRREGGLVVAKKAKPSCGASVLANEMWGAFISGRGTLLERGTLWLRWWGGAYKVAAAGSRVRLH